MGQVVENLVDGLRGVTESFGHPLNRSQGSGRVDRDGVVRELGRGLQLDRRRDQRKWHIAEVLGDDHAGAADLGCCQDVFIIRVWQPVGAVELLPSGYFGAVEGLSHLLDEVDGSLAGFVGIAATVDEFECFVLFELGEDR